MGGNIHTSVDVQKCTACASDGENRYTEYELLFAMLKTNRRPPTTTETVPAAPQKPDSAYTDNILSLLWPTTGLNCVEEGVGVGQRGNAKGG